MGKKIAKKTPPALGFERRRGKYRMKKSNKGQDCNALMMALRTTMMMLIITDPRFFCLSLMVQLLKSCTGGKVNFVCSMVRVGHDLVDNRSLQVLVLLNHLRCVCVARDGAL